MINGVKSVGIKGIEGIYYGIWNGYKLKDQEGN
jgi:hypothetical protein